MNGRDLRSLRGAVDARQRRVRLLRRMVLLALLGSIPLIWHVAGAARARSLKAAITSQDWAKADALCPADRVPWTVAPLQRHGWRGAQAFLAVRAGHGAGAGPESWRPGKPPLGAAEAAAALWKDGADPALAARYLEAVGAEQMDPAWWDQALDVAVACGERGVVERLVSRDVVNKDVRVMASAALRSGFPRALDQTGSVIATDQGWTGAFSPAYAMIEPLLPAEHRGTLRLTLDPVVQRAAQEAFIGGRGSALVIDVDGRLLALAASGSGPTGLEEGFLPASTVKLVTGGAALDAGVASIFPFDAKPVKAGGGAIYDWGDKGSMESFEHALAVSCNSCFAKMALGLGEEPWRHAMTQAGFNQQWTLDGRPLALGALDAPAEGHGEYAFARSAIGLQGSSVNLAHLALLGAAVARGGVAPPLHLVNGRRTPMGLEAQEEASPDGQQRWFSQDASARLLAGMTQAVTREDGTGALARPSGRSWPAVKTGGYMISGTHSALIIALWPAEKPVMVIAAHLPDAGLPREHAGPYVRRLVEGLPAEAVQDAEQP